MKALLFSPALLCSLFVNFTYVSAQPAVNNGVVKIKAYDQPNPNTLPSVGAGIVVGKQNNYVYILTAYHVCVISDSIGQNLEVLFYENMTQPYTGLVRNYDMELDIAVLRVALSPDEQAKNPIYDSLPELWKGDPSKLKMSTPVTSIGHPLGRNWQTNVANTIANLSYAGDLRKLTFTKTSIDIGCSGGPLLDEQRRLIGIITSIDGIEAIAVQIDPILALLDNWEVPTNLIQRPPVTPCGAVTMPLTNRKISLLTLSLGTLTAGNFAWYLTAKNKAEDKFAEYRAAASTEEAVSRRIQTEKARARRNVAGYVSLSTGGVFAIMLVRDLLRCKPQKSKPLTQSALLEKEKKRLGVKLNSEPDGHTLSLNVQLSF